MIQNSEELCDKSDREVIKEPKVIVD